ncbi:MAG: hypothetical protein OXC26_08110 [Albidovulum sp.]|nr:hypothetical protein [Albidovulum sp.]
MSEYYRMIEHSNAAAESVEAILATHRRRTLEMAGQSTVLLIQDGCDLNFATRPGFRGPGLIAKNEKSSGTLGLHMQSVYAVGGDRNPLGAPGIEFNASCARKEGDEVPEEKRKTQRWVRGLRDSGARGTAGGRPDGGGDGPRGRYRRGLRRAAEPGRRNRPARARPARPEPR